MIGSSVDKKEWLGKIQEVRSEWLHVLSQIGTGRMLEPGAEGDWTVKDVIAHATFWEERSVKNLEAAIAGQAPEPSPYAGLDTDQYNAGIYNDNKDKSLDDVLSWSDDVHSRLLAAIDRLSEEDLTNPTLYPWLQAPLWEHVEGNSTEHVREHTEGLRAWLNRTNAA